MTDSKKLAVELPEGYEALVSDLKSRVRAARSRATLAVNAELIGLYWEIGRGIIERQRGSEWGSGVLDRVAAELKREFPDMTGFSRTNLKYMRQFAEAWPDGLEFGPQAVGQIPWGHNRVLLNKLEDPEARAWYAQKAVANGWSRAVLEAQIATKLIDRQGSALTSFEHALPGPESDLVQDAIKDPYNFEFLALAEHAREKDLEDALISEVQAFLLEMGRGFALVGRQWNLKVKDEETGEEQDFFIDLLFFNYLLNRFVVVDLKIEDFKPEFAGKMQFYVNALDDLERQDGHAETIGLILCPGRNATVAKWALRGVSTPVGVARYDLGATDVEMVDQTPPELEEAVEDLPALTDELTETVAKAEADAESAEAHEAD